MESRSVIQQKKSVERIEGYKARLRRAIGVGDLKVLDPFVLFDEFGVFTPGGFPDHPHRGAEILTYLFDGELQYEDCYGNSGIMRAGDLMWVTTGKGLVRSEKPIGDVEAHGFHIWIASKKPEKLIEPKLQELESMELPTSEKNGVRIKVIVGENGNLCSPVVSKIPMLILDVIARKGVQFDLEVPELWSGFIYIIQGSMHVGNEGNHTLCKRGYLSILSNEQRSVHFDTDIDHCHFVFVAAQPINEPIVVKGPFVMNSKEEAQQSSSDFKEFKNGFEIAEGWSSSTRKRRSSFFQIIPGLHE